MVTRDLCGLSLTAASSFSVDYYSDIVTNLSVAQDPSSLLERATESDPNFVLGHVIKGYMTMMFTDLDFHDSAKANLDCVNALLDKKLPINSREELHINALTSWVDGDIAKASQILYEIIEQYPQCVFRRM